MYCADFTFTRKIILIKSVVLKCVIPKSLHSWHRLLLFTAEHTRNCSVIDDIDQKQLSMECTQLFVCTSGVKSEWKSKPKGSHSISAKHVYIPNNIGLISQLNGITPLSFLHNDEVCNFFLHLFYLYIVMLSMIRSFHLWIEWFYL